MDKLVLYGLIATFVLAAIAVGASPTGLQVAGFHNATCADSDGGDMPYTAGIVTYTNPLYGAREREDTCSAKRLVEWSCSRGNSPSAKVHECRYGCEKGTCLAEPTSGGVSSCGNSVCEHGENSANCPSDCGTNPSCAQSIEPSISCGTDQYRKVTVTCADGMTRTVGGSGLCKTTEFWEQYGAALCKNHCSLDSCGNNACDNGETSTSCPTDCRQLSACIHSFELKETCARGSTRGATVICADGANRTIELPSTCRPASFWLANAEAFCRTHCAQPTCGNFACEQGELSTCPQDCSPGSCGVKSFENYNECGPRQYESMKVSCGDGTSIDTGETTCKSAATWETFARAFCSGTCTQSTKECTTCPTGYVANGNSCDPACIQQGCRMASIACPQ